MGGAGQLMEEQTRATGSALSIPLIAFLSASLSARQHCLVADRTFMPFLLVPDVRRRCDRATWGTRWLGPDASMKPLHAAHACCARRLARPSRPFCKTLPSSR